MKAVFKEQHYYNDNAARKIYEKLQQVHLAAPKPLFAAKKLQASAWAEILIHMATVVKQYEQRLETLIDKHPDGKIFLSYPGVGHSNAARLLALFGDNRNLRRDASEVQALVGSAPVTEKGAGVCASHTSGERATSSIVIPCTR